MKKFEELIQSGEIFDSHCHLSALEKSGLAVESARAAGVGAIIDMATDMESAEAAVARSLEYPDFVFATAAIHPEFLVPHTDMSQDAPWNAAKIAAELTKLQNFVEVNQNNLIMLGECGLDYYWLEKTDLNPDQIQACKVQQIELFEAQIQLAIKYDLPLSLHIREAFADAYAILKKYPKARGIFHSFTNDYIEAKKILELGFYLGINGIATYKSANLVRESITQIMGKPINREPIGFYKAGIVFETDAPYLRPSNAKNSGKLNEPKNILHVYEYCLKLISD